MVDESNDLFFTDFSGDCWGLNSRVTLPITNPFEEYYDRKFKERFQLSKTTVLRLLSEITTEYFLFHFTAINIRCSIAT